MNYFTDYTELIRGLELEVWLLFIVLGNITLWIFFIWTFKWSVLLNIWPHVLQGWGTNLPLCRCRTCRNSVHFRLKTRAHITHWNFVPSGVWHRVNTESVLVIRLSLVGEAISPLLGLVVVRLTPPLAKMRRGGDKPLAAVHPSWAPPLPSETREDLVTVFFFLYQDKSFDFALAGKW